LDVSLCQPYSLVQPYQPPHLSSKRPRRDSPQSAPFQHGQSRAPIPTTRASFGRFRDSLQTNASRGGWLAHLSLGRDRRRSGTLNWKTPPLQLRTSRSSPPGHHSFPPARLTTCFVRAARAFKFLSAPIGYATVFVFVPWSCAFRPFPARVCCILSREILMRDFLSPVPARRLPPPVISFAHLLKLRPPRDFEQICSVSTARTLPALVRLTFAPGQTYDACF